MAHNKWALLLLSITLNCITEWDYFTECVLLQWSALHCGEIILNGAQMGFVSNGSHDVVAHSFQVKVIFNDVLLIKTKLQ